MKTGKEFDAHVRELIKRWYGQEPWFKDEMSTEELVVSVPTWWLNLMVLKDIWCSVYVDKSPPEP